VVHKVFNNQWVESGRSQTLYNTSNSVVSTTLLSRTVGSTGSLDTFSHPYPYVTGGPFGLSRVRNHYGFADGIRTPSGNLHYTYQNWAIDAAVSNGVAATLMGSSTFNDVLAQTNPSRPHIDLPYFFGELRELPELVWKAGGGLLKSTARANLTSEFGWELLVSDLKSMLDFQAAVDRRVAHLSSGFRKGGFRFQRELRRGSYQNNSVTNSSIFSGAEITSRKYGAIREWCSVSWCPNEDVRNGIPSPSEIRRRAFRACIGGTVDAATVWNLLPWTWLIDWFGDTGSYLSSKRNLVGFAPGSCYIMTHSLRGTDHSYRILPTSSFKGSLKPPIYLNETKSRTVGSGVSLTAGLPILSGRQFGILGSLAVLKLL